MKFKSLLSNFLRKLHVLHQIDIFRFYLTYLRHYSAIQKVKRKYPSFIFPSAYYIYETYHLDYEHYYLDGRQTAGEILDLVEKYEVIKNKQKKILDWGCGPARVIRHIPELNPAYKAFGSDYNTIYVEWCSQHIKNVTFIHNPSTPPIAVNENTFDAVYALSIITHLSEKGHIDWMEELNRILKPGGILLLTSQGDQCKEKLLPDELHKYNSGALVIRASNKEGNRSYSAFQPKSYMEKLLHSFHILEFIPGNSSNSIHGVQDTWVLRK